jgi:superfamily II DNA or RNA helicase
VQFSAGDVVSVRGGSWVVDQATPLADCTLLSLSAERPQGTRESCTLLLPFDRPVLSPRTTRIAAVRPRRWMRHFHFTIGDLRRHGHLSGTAEASIDILPFQLEPALALIEGVASRFLLADEVGLGKTVQAALMMAELQRRGWCERALILVPSGLRKQWADELKRRFDISSVIVDAEHISTLTHSLPQDINPWSVEPVAITSIDFVKQPEVLHGLRGLVWDILIVDEAHHAASGSLRYDAVAMLARRSRHVVLLTATPHAGDAEAYRAMCDLGKTEPRDPILLFRRTRQQAGLPRARHVHLLSVRLTSEETEMHRLLDSYVAGLWRIGQATDSQEVRLVATVLRKRSFSSAHSLAASVERRLSAISGEIPAPSQPSLLFDGDDGCDDEALHVSAPAFDRADEEGAVLQTILMAARRAEKDESKLRALKRLLRRVHEPVIVFTEYRDTLETLEREFRGDRKVSMIHGGQRPQDRRDAVNRFTGGTNDLLLATDAGAEGLNLHCRCRAVVNLELPWNPIRLEQRIGRVDRIGQARAVHAINLYADSTAESTVLASLVRRLDRIQASEIEVAASVITDAPLPARKDESQYTCTETVDLKVRACEEASRTFQARFRRKVGSGLLKGIVPVTRIRSRHLNAVGISTAHVIYAVRLRIANAAGRLVEDVVVPVAVRVPEGVVLAREVRSTAEQWLRQHRDAVVGFAADYGRQRAASIDRGTAEATKRAVRREHRISAVAAGEPAQIQPGLFDNRALSRQLAEERHHRTILDECAQRTSLIEGGATTVLAQEPQIELMLITC